jgi:predicted metal-dependent hydrolase
VAILSGLYGLGLSNLKSKTIELKSVGAVLLERSRRAKRISVSIQPFKGIRVAVPYGVSFDSARRFAESKADWIKKHLGKMEQLEYRAKVASAGTPINRSAARRFLVDRLDYLAKQYGFTYNRVFVRNQKTRWGSCSTKNNINLNVNLVRLPVELIDYTILHELVHTRVKNHGRKFWDQMDMLLGDAKKIDKQLSAYEFLLI